MARNRQRRKKIEHLHKDAVKQAQELGAPNRAGRHQITNGEVEYRDEGALHIRPMPVCFAIPTDEIMYSKFMTMFMRHANVMPWDDFAFIESTYLPDARNALHNTFVEHSEYPYLMMLDSDVLFPKYLVEKLIAHDKPIIGGWYKNKNRLKQHTPHPIVYDYVSTSKDGTVNWRHREAPGVGVEKVDGMGAGCWLMKREVAETLGLSPYDMAGGTEDLKLSKKLIDLGIPLYVDWDLECAHVGVSWV